MKVLSLIQPWASLWVAGIKRIETRSWGTAYRGKVAVHASKTFNRELCFADPFFEALGQIGIDHPGKLPTGALLGWVDLVDVREMFGGGVHMPAGFCLLNGCPVCPQLTPLERALGLYERGRRAWLTGGDRLVAAEPVPYRGAQGLRDLPDAVAELLVANR